jgi:phospholipase D1/2
LRDFLLGTVIGMLPGILATVVFVDRIVEALRNPSALTFITLALVIGLVVGAMVALRRRLAGIAGGEQRPA